MIIYKSPLREMMPNGNEKRSYRFNFSRLTNVGI